MTYTLADIGFDLNNREIVLLIYLGLVLTAILLWRKGRSSALNVIRAFFAFKLSIVWLFMSLYVAGSVWLLACLGLWDWPNLKSTLPWWMMVGFTCVWKAQKIQDQPHILRQLIRETLTLSAVIIFIAELVSFPLFVELLLFPFLAGLTLFITTAESQMSTPGIHQLVQLLRSLQILIGFTILSISYWFVASDITKFWSLNTLREFGLPLMLWIMFVPFLYLLAVYMTYEASFMRLKIRPKQAPIVNYAWRSALFNFGCNIEGVKRFARSMRVLEITDKQGVQDTLREVKETLKIEKKPPVITRAEGWSPFAARKFLEEYDLTTEDYHRTPWDWSTSSPLINIKNMFLADQISYDFSGNKDAVTQLRIRLKGSNRNDEQEAQHTFDKYALALLEKALNISQPEKIYAYVQQLEPEPLVTDDIDIFIDQEKWGDTRQGGYERSLTIRHSKHPKISF